MCCHSEQSEESAFLGLQESRYLGLGLLMTSVLSAPELCGTGTLACAKASTWRMQAPARVPVPHKHGHSAFNMPQQVSRLGMIKMDISLRTQKRSILLKIGHCKPRSGWNLRRLTPIHSKLGATRRGSIRSPLQ